jgi:hypothetical protein
VCSLWIPAAAGLTCRKRDLTWSSDRIPLVLELGEEVRVSIAGPVPAAEANVYVLHEGVHGGYAEWDARGYYTFKSMAAGEWIVAAWAEYRGARYEGKTRAVAGGEVVTLTLLQPE